MNNDYASSSGGSGVTGKQLYGLLGLAIGIGWIYYNIRTNIKQNKRITVLERLLQVDEKGKPGSGYANFAIPPDSSGVTHGAAPGAVSDFNVSDAATGVHNPNLAIIRSNGRIFIERRV